MSTNTTKNLVHIIAFSSKPYLIQNFKKIFLLLDIYEVICKSVFGLRFVL